jgi:hypothetical protein
MRLLTSERQSYPEALFSDRLLYLEILRQLPDPGFAEYLRKLEQDAASDPADLARLLSWMNSNETAAPAVEFEKPSPQNLEANGRFHPHPAAAGLQTDGAPAGARDSDSGRSAAPFGGNPLLVRELPDWFRSAPPPANFHDASGVGAPFGVRLKVHDRL